MSKGKEKRTKNAKKATEKSIVSVNYPLNDNLNQGHNARKESLGPNTDR